MSDRAGWAARGLGAASKILGLRAAPDLVGALPRFDPAGAEADDQAAARRLPPSRASGRRRAELEMGPRPADQHLGWPTGRGRSVFTLSHGWLPARG